MAELIGNQNPWNSPLGSVSSFRLLQERFQFPPVQQHMSDLEALSSWSTFPNLVESVYNHNKKTYTANSLNPFLATNTNTLEESKCDFNATLFRGFHKYTHQPVIFFDC